MLTPQDISDKKFDKVIMGGYDMGAVDAFLDDIEKDYSQIYKENIVLKNKMKVLVAKIEEYRTVDESMRKALLSAQGMASSIIEKAKTEAESIEKTAAVRAEELIASYSGRIAAEEMRLEEAKTGVEAFVERMLAMYERETAFLRDMKEQEFQSDPEFNAETEIAASAPVRESAPVQTVVNNTVVKKSGVLPDTVPLPNIPPVPEDTLQKRPAAAQSTRVFESDLSLNSELPNSVKRSASQNEEDEEVIMLTPKPRFEFNDLQFGENYDNGAKKKK